MKKYISFANICNTHLCFRLLVKIQCDITDAPYAAPDLQGVPGGHWLWSRNRHAKSDNRNLSVPHVVRPSTAYGSGSWPSSISWNNHMSDDGG